MSEQSMGALARANEVRQARFIMKTKVAAGKISVQDVIVDPPDVMEEMKVVDLLACWRGKGRTRARGILSRAGVSESRKLVDLTETQRNDLLWQVSAG